MLYSHNGLGSGFGSSPRQKALVVQSWATETGNRDKGSDCSGLTCSPPSTLQKWNFPHERENGVPVPLAQVKVSDICLYVPNFSSAMPAFFGVGKRTTSAVLLGDVNVYVGNE